MARTLTVTIRRSDGTPDAPARWDTFTLDAHPRMNVLDVVASIQADQDPSLAFRFSCRAGMCGTCSMRVNGRNRWTCRTPVERLGTDTLVLEPLPHFPVIRDLAVDLEPMVEHLDRIIPHFVPADPNRQGFAKIPSTSRERRQIDPHVECIGCGNCFGACSFVATNRDYLGPHALNRAFTLIADSRDGAGAERLERLNRHGGVWGCHTQFNCTDVCPVGISPTRAIQELKRKEVWHGLTKPFR
jgi:succinate dehydrogenase/fumarate reductase iron-sulfur protein